MSNREQSPFDPARFPFFYGWMIAFVGTIGIVVSIPGQTIGVSAFTDSLLESLRISRVTLASAYMYGTIASSLLLPLAGRVFDQRGARVLVAASSASLGMTLVYLSQCDRLRNATASLLGLGENAHDLLTLSILTLGFFLVRFWGQGVLTMVSRAMIGKWFQQQRGLVIGISGVVVSASFAIAPRVLSWSNGLSGWRGTWLILAVSCGVFSVLGWVFYRDNPEECGLRMDGVLATSAEDREADEARTEVHFTLSEAMRTYVFWIFNFALALPAMIGTAITFHIVDLGAKANMNATAVIGIFPYMAVCSVIANLAGGWLSDRIRIKYLLWGLLSFQALAAAGLLYFESSVGYWLVTAGLGFSGGLFALTMGVIWPRFFGRTHLGSISSVNLSILVFASAVGPWLYALSEDYTGRYDLAAIFSSALALVCLALALNVENPQKRPRRRGPPES